MYSFNQVAIFVIMGIQLKTRILFERQNVIVNGLVFLRNIVEMKRENGKKFLLRHFFGQVLNRNNPSFIRASLLSKEYFISPRFCLLEFKITSNLEKYFCGFIHV
jgi:hypothetical protein